MQFEPIDSRAELRPHPGSAAKSLPLRLYVPTGFHQFANHPRQLLRRDLPRWPGLAVSLLRLLHAEIVQSLNRRLLYRRVPSQVSLLFGLMETVEMGIVGKRRAVVIEQEFPMHHDLAPSLLFGKLQNRAGAGCYLFDATLYGPVDFRRLGGRETLGN